MANFDYFKQYVSEMERIKAETAHDEHIIEFRAMCSKMINDAIPEIKQQCMEECKKELESSKHLSQKGVDVMGQNTGSVGRTTMPSFFPPLG